MSPALVNGFFTTELPGKPDFYFLRNLYTVFIVIVIDIFRTFHPNAEEYTFFSSAHGTFSRIDHILGHKSNLSKLKKIEIV